MNLVLGSKSDRKLQELAKTKIVQKTAYMRHSTLFVKIFEKSHAILLF